MSIPVAASLFALLVIVYWVISEIFTMLFRFVGLPEEKARFQVASLLTGCGFTTRESEMILSSKSRRRIARAIMLFGYVFNITVVSAFVNVFLSLKESQIGNYFLDLVIPLTVIALVFVVSRLRFVRNLLDRLINKVFGSITKNNTQNFIMVIDNIGKGTIAQVKLREMPEFLVGVPLAKCGLKEERRILVMLVERPGGRVDAPTGNTVFEVGDTLTVFGDYKGICQTFKAKERFS